jgi:hypothetical protein
MLRIRIKVMRNRNPATECTLQYGPPADLQPWGCYLENTMYFMSLLLSVHCVHYDPLQLTCSHEVVPDVEGVEEERLPPVGRRHNEEGRDVVLPEIKSKISKIQNIR